MAKNKANTSIFDTSDLTQAAIEDIKSNKGQPIVANPYTDTHTDTEELKTKRMYLLVRPSVAIKINAAAKMQKTSANELIHRLMEQYIKENNI